MRQAIDLTPFVCEAFASNRRVHRMIEKVYEKSRVLYYQQAKANKWYNHEILTSQSIEQEVVAKRALGILIEGDREKVLPIVRNGWRTLYNWAKEQPAIKVSGALNLIMPKDPAALDKLTNDEINAYGIIAMILGLLLEKEIDQEDEGCQVLLNSLNTRLQWAEGLGRFSYATLTKEEKAKSKRLKNEVYRFANTNRFFVSYPDTVHEDTANMLTGLCFLFDTEGLSTGIVESEVLLERDINEIVASYVCSHAETSVPDASRFLVAGHIVKALLRAYKNLKKQHFKTSRETLFLDLDTAQHKAQEACEEVKRLRGIIAQREKEIHDLGKQVKSEYGRAVAEYQAKLKMAQEEGEALRASLTQVQDRVNELELALFSADREEDDGVSGPPVDMSSIRGIIVGGHQRWHVRMREVLPASWRLIHPDNGIDLSIISGADIVLFFTDYLSHSAYNAVISEARRRNIPVGYLRRTNEAECLEEIQRLIRKEGIKNENN